VYLPSAASFTARVFTNGVGTYAHGGYFGMFNYGNGSRIQVTKL
jgi:hypothetical protein